MSKRIDFGWKEFFKPTPKRIKAFGNALVAASTTATGILVLTDHKGVGVAVFVAGVVGKFLSEFFSEKSTEE